MIKKINLFILTLVIIFMNTQYAYAYVFKNWAQAEVLKIIFLKLNTQNKHSLIQTSLFFKKFHQTSLYSM